jgi:tetratricopeptide (TPR) repeat protein
LLRIHFQPLRQMCPLSELLEKGIYTEETRGDLPSAISIYQQLLADAKASQSIAAQAQFRLAQCFLKQNRTADAEAAFEKLIRDFPQEKELVAKAREHVAGDLALLPAPWVDGERLQLTLTLANGLDIGSMEYRADVVESEGRKLWRVGARMFSNAHSVSWVDAEPENFRPVASYWKHGMLGEVSAVFRDGGQVEMQRKDKDEPHLVTLDKPVFDNEQNDARDAAAALAGRLQANDLHLFHARRRRFHPHRTRGGGEGGSANSGRQVRLLQSGAQRQPDVLVLG